MRSSAEIIKQLSNQTVFFLSFLFPLPFTQNKYTTTFDWCTQLIWFGCETIFTKLQTKLFTTIIIFSLLVIRIIQLIYRFVHSCFLRVFLSVSLHFYFYFVLLYSLHTALIQFFMVWLHIISFVSMFLSAFLLYVFLAFAAAFHYYWHFVKHQLLSV